MTDHLVRAKLLAQKSSAKPLGWDEAHELMRVSIAAGRQALALEMAREYGILDVMERSVLARIGDFLDEVSDE